MKRKIIIGIVALAAIAFVSGVSILALAAPGSQDNPFITLSYLTNIFRPQVMDELSKAEKELIAQFDRRIKELEDALKQSQSGAQTSPGKADAFSVVTLSRGQSLTCSVGTEVMLRIGTASGFGSAPALVDYTKGDILYAGQDLVTNNMYLITIEGNGVKATAATVRVLVRGVYTVS